MYAILGFIFAISLLAAVHELGHFSVARLLGVKVLCFSIGFGKALWSRFDKFGTEYVFAAIPLGGYVKMQEGTASPLSFDNKPVWARMLIIAAGPGFNLIFAVLAYWAIFMLSYDALPALQHAFVKTADNVLLTLHFLGKMAIGQMSLDNVAGPISIARFAGLTAQSGWPYFMNFLALISISLGVLNMLPIPILDGGHFLFCLIELVRGKPLSAAAVNFGQRIGFAFLGTLMVLAMYNDLVRVFHPG